MASQEANLQNVIKPANDEQPIDKVVKSF